MIQIHHINTIDGTEDGSDIILHIEASIEIDDNKIYYFAAKSPDTITSFTGSFLPFYNEDQAYDNSENIGFVTLDANNKSTIKIKYPNAYYADLGNTFVKPHIKIWFNKDSKKHEQIVKLSDGVGYRSLTHPYQRTSADFYDTLWRLPVRSQEQILRDSMFPKSEDHDNGNFWKLKPPK